MQKRSKDDSDNSPLSEDDDYVPYVPIKERRKQKVSAHPRQTIWCIPSVTPHLIAWFVDEVFEFSDILRRKSIVDLKNQCLIVCYIFNQSQPVYNHSGNIFTNACS